MKRYVVFCISFLFVIIYAARFATFIQTQKVGVEHDSGWYLGVARNLAEKGRYASYTNTIADTAAPGDSASIHGRFSVQDREGYSYFPAGVTVGPGFIIPQAIIYKLFGQGVWQNRALSFFSFVVLISVLIYIAYLIGGPVALILLLWWLWFFPQVFLILSFESFSEQLALLYLCCGYLFIYYSEKRGWASHLLVMGGVVISLAALTKNLYAIGIAPPLVVLISMFFRRKKNQQIVIIQVCLYLVAIILPLLLFELYRFISLYSLFGIDGYIAILKDNYLTMKCCGSGILQFIEHPFPIRFMLRKLFVFDMVGFHPILFFFLFFAFFYQLYSSQKHLLQRLFLLFFFLFFGWFFMLSSTGFFRHAWPSVVIGVITLFSYLRYLGRLRYSLTTLFLIIIVISQYSVPSFYILPSKLDAIRHKTGGSSGPLFINPFSLIDQEQVKIYFQKKIPHNLRICYDETLLVAELPIYIDRVFFPIQRCRPQDILIIGPYQKQFLIRKETYLPTLLAKRCKNKLFENKSYTACLLK